ncbi:S-adenosyl-L-methionine-dependent methyltransferase, partial [Aulographum hederae CBS 113979]
MDGIDLSTERDNSPVESEPARDESPLDSDNLLEPSRNGPVGLESEVLKSFRLTADVIEPLDTVELLPCPPSSLSSGRLIQESGDFLWIRKIFRDRKNPSKVFLRGLRMRRNKYLGCMLPHKLNELCFVVDIDVDDNRAWNEQGQETIPIETVLRKRDLLVTHAEYPKLSLLAHGRKPNTKSGTLICRWIHCSIYRSSRERQQVAKKPHQGLLRRVSPAESEESSISEHVRREDRDGTYECYYSSYVAESFTPSFGSRKRKRQGSIDSVIEIKEEDVKRYTFADAFCGAGGASAGAKMAGLDIAWAFDSEALALKAYRSNFPNADAIQCKAEDFKACAGNLDAIGRLSVDILHLSPPCQYWSPAHTVVGKDDDANRAALYVVGHIIDTVKPRIVTLEQTKGLFTHHRPAFWQLVDMIRAVGYNVSYFSADFAEWGLVQRRKRLVVVASREGIPIPPFPAPTHVPDNCLEGRDGLLPSTTVHKALLNIPQTATWHDTNQCPIRTELAYGATRHQLVGCITTHGSKNTHHSGLRSHTPRELARFQTFPDAHIFIGTEEGRQDQSNKTGVTNVFRQIGNAVPPAIWALFLQECIRTLEDYDAGRERP